MLVGETISFYVDTRLYAKDSIWVSNLPGFSDNIHFGDKSYTLEEKDIGRKMIKMEQKNDRRDILERHIIVIPGNQG